MTAPEFTGERFIPGQGGAQIAYEHLHRYLYARRWARHKRVVDVAAGAGYGAALLAEAANIVWAVELDETTVAQARLDYGKSNLLFVRGDARHLPFPSACVDMVVALEILEHVAEQDGLVREIARVLRPDGIAMISTPNKAVYTDAREYANPFHVRELYRDEFLNLLRGSFSEVRVMAHQVRAGSLIIAEEGSGEDHEVIARTLENHEATPAMYFLALCSAKAFLPLSLPASAYMDPADSLIVEWKNEIARLNAEIRKLGRWGKQLESEVDARDRSIRQVHEEIASRDKALGQLQVEFEERSRWAQSLRDELADRDSRLGRTQEELERVSAHLARIRHAFPYRVLCRLGFLPK